MPAWHPFPHDAAAYDRPPAALKRVWARLHAGDAEPLPNDARLLDAWRTFHAGDFERAVGLGLEAVAAGAPAGLTVANKAQALYATYLEPSERVREALFLEVVERAQRRTGDDRRDANAWYSLAYALGRYSQGVSVARALAEGIGARVKLALDTTIRLSPQHADAWIALGAFHAEVIDKVGSLLGRTQGASRDAGLAAFKTGLRLNPTSAIGMLEYARGLVMLEGEKRLAEATRLTQAAAACEPLDAAERLDVDRARTELEE
jgi:hypothetical protein